MGEGGSASQLRHAIRPLGDTATLGPLRMAESLGYQLIKLGRSVERRLQRQLDGRSIGASQLLALTHIAHNPGVSRAALARGLEVSPQAAGKLTAQLHAGGLIVRTEHRAGQPTRHAVTPDGVRTLAATAHVIQDVTQDVAKRLAPAHRHLLAQIVGHILASCKDG